MKYLPLYIIHLENMKQIRILYFCTVVILLENACTSTKKATTATTSNTTTNTTTINDTDKDDDKSDVVAWQFVYNQQSNLESIIERAKQEQKLIFIDNYATWCGPCKLMDRTVFKDSETAKFFNQHFISYKVDIEKDNGPTLQLIYEIAAVPTLVMIDSKGNVLAKNENSMTASQLLDMAKMAIAKSKK